MNPVNIKWQCLATILLPTGLYAFKRIGKLRQGIWIYVITFIGSITVLISPFFFWASTNQIKTINDIQVYQTFDPLSILITAFSIIIPIIFISRWSKEFNSHIKIVS